MAPVCADGLVCRDVNGNLEVEECLTLEICSVDWIYACVRAGGTAEMTFGLL